MVIKFDNHPGLVDSQSTTYHAVVTAPVEPVNNRHMGKNMRFVRGDVVDPFFMAPFGEIHVHESRVTSLKMCT